MHEYVVGQRWRSDTESDLGLGSILCIEPRRVTLRFLAGDQTRIYATDSAPLTDARAL